MDVVNCSWDEFPHEIGNRKIFCFGAGTFANIFLDLLETRELLGRIEAFVDNSPSKVGTYKNYKDSQFQIIAANTLPKVIRGNIVLITCSDTEAVVSQLEKMQGLEDTCVYSMYIMLAKQFRKSRFDEMLRMEQQMKIPKKIHYCWFGDNEMPEKNKACIESWKKFCPDYEIIEWSEKNYDYTKNRYMYQAYQCKKWGFVPDYARLDIIYQHGGIYLDVDVEIVRNIDDLLYQQAFSGFDSQFHVNFGSGFGAAQGDEFIKELRDYYDSVEFVLPGGACDLTPCMTHQQNVFQKYGIVLDGSLQNICGMTIYPTVVMNGIDMNAYTERKEWCTCFCHHADGSWLSDKLMDARWRRVNYVRKYLEE